MKPPRFSIKRLRLETLWQRVAFWGSLLLLLSWVYYSEFFDVLPALFMAFVFTCIIFGMVLFGYLWISTQKKFPKAIFWSITLAFCFVRWLNVFFVLQHHLPEWTVYHHPDRAIFFLFFSSAIVIFFGYSYAVYEWGLAARQEYQNMMLQSKGKIQSPITIRSEGRTVRLLPQDILYLEAKGEYIKYCTISKNYMAFQRMKHAQNILKGYGLFRAHRSYIINPLHVKSFSSYELTMVDGKNIPVSKTYKNSILSSIKIV